MFAPDLGHFLAQFEMKVRELAKARGVEPTNRLFKLATNSDGDLLIIAPPKDGEGEEVSEEEFEGFIGKEFRRVVLGYVANKTTLDDLGVWIKTRSWRIRRAEPELYGQIAIEIIDHFFGVTDEATFRANLLALVQ